MKKLLLTTLLAFALVGVADAKPHKKHKKIKSRSAKTVMVKKQKSTGYVHYATGSYVLFDYDNGEFNDEFNRNQVRSIASITKMFTAITVINSTANLYEKLYVAGHNGGKVPWHLCKSYGFT